MPKQKTKKSFARRFKITGTGKVLRRCQYSRHKRTNKSKSRKRIYRKGKKVGTKQGNMIKKMIIN